MPGGKDFRTLFDDPTVWINYDPKNDSGSWGWTAPTSHPKDLVVSQFALRMGLWSTAATIVHELAHLDGAPGGASKTAENTVAACRMRSGAGPFNPNIMGQLIQRRHSAFA